MAFPFKRKALVLLIRPICIVQLESYSVVWLRLIILLVIWLTSFTELRILETKPLYCYDETMNNTSQPCPMTYSDTIRCQYSKIDSSSSPAPSTDILFIPGAPRAFQLEPFAIQHYDSCYQAINFTWKLPIGNSENVEGFLLNITFIHSKESKQILRMFDLSFNSLTKEDLIKVLFHYDCFVPIPNTLYRIELHSLPPAEHKEQNYAALSLQTPPGCGVVDANNTASWTSLIWMIPNIDTSTLEICFSLAPTEFRFSKYNIYLIPHRLGILRLYNIHETIEIPQDDSLKMTVCHQFKQVCSDIYNIEIEPVADEATCNCKLQGRCNERCSPSAIENIPMTKSSLPCSHGPASSLTAGSPTPEKWPKDETLHPVIAVVTGLLSSIIVISLLAIFRHQIRAKIRPKIAEEKRKRIVILYSSGIDGSKEFIEALSGFLKEHCLCEVSVYRWNDWSRHMANVERIQTFIKSSDNTVFILSRKVWFRYKNALKGIIDPPVSTGSSEDLAVASDLLKLEMRTESKSLANKCSQVFLTSSLNGDSMSQKVFENCYEFPKEIDSYLKATCGITKLSRKQKLALKAVFSCEQASDCQPLLHQVVVDETQGEFSETVTNNNRFSFTDLNIEENSSVVLQIEGSTRLSRSSSDSAYSTFSLPIGAVADFLQLHDPTDTFGDPQGMPMDLFTASFVPPNPSACSGSVRLSSLSLVAPSSLGSSFEDIEKEDIE